MHVLLDTCAFPLCTYAFFGCSNCQMEQLQKCVQHTHKIQIVLFKEVASNGYCYTYGFCMCQLIQLCQETRSNKEFGIPESCVCGRWGRMTLQVIVCLSCHG